MAVKYGSTGGGIPPWRLVSSVTIAAPAAAVSFPDLGRFTEIAILARAVTASVNGSRAVQVSIDNGATFLTAAGDYVSVDPAGVETNQNMVNLTNAATMTGQTCEAIIRRFGLSGSPKSLDRLNRDNPRYSLIPATAPLNAVRLINSTGGNLTGGTVSVFAL